MCSPRPRRKALTKTHGSPGDLRVTEIRAQQFVVHAFAPADGPGADAAWHAISEIWRGCGPLFGMTAPLAETGLPAEMPVRATARTADGEVALAAKGRPGATCQAVLRLHHDVLNLSVGIAPPEAMSPRHGEWPWWRDLDYQWNLLAGPQTARLLGEARIFLAPVDAEAAIGRADPALYETLKRLLPDDARSHAPVGVPFPGGFTVWETAARPDDRTVRRLLVALAPDTDPAVSAWAWSDSTTAIPPLARYLLHAAKIRYELRVWQRDGQARRLWESLDALGTELRRAGTVDTATRELLRLRRLDAALHRADLLAMARTVEIAADNLGRGFTLSDLSTPRSMFADDSELARSLVERLRDEADYLGIAMDRAAHVAELLAPAPPVPAPPSGISQASAPGANGEITEADRRRNVLVVYGRDEPARLAVFDFLRSLGLHPLEWEELVKATGKMAPFLSESVRKGMEIAAAAVVLLTPEDIVQLHPELHDPNDGAHEVPGMQARPNVLLELGMALAAKPEATLILLLGEQRPATDLGGMSYVRLTGGAECRSRIADRLRAAGCLVNPVGTDWLTAGDFTRLAAQRRRP